MSVVQQSRYRPSLARNQSPTAASYATKDASSNATGSSVFDFQGDGAAQVDVSNRERGLREPYGEFRLLDAAEALVWF